MTSQHRRTAALHPHRPRRRRGRRLRRRRRPHLRRAGRRRREGRDHRPLRGAAGRGPQGGREGRRRGAGDRRRHGRQGRRRRRHRSRRWTPSAGSTSWSTASAAAPAPRCTRPRSTRRPEWDRILDLNLTTALLVSPGRGAGDDRRRPRRLGAQHQLGARPARHRRRLLGLRRRQGRDGRPHPAARHRVGQARHPGQRDLADVRAHRAGGHAARRSRASTTTWSAASRCAGSPTPTTWSARCCSSAPTPRRS